MSISPFHYRTNHFVPPIMDQKRIEARAKMVEEQSACALESQATFTRARTFFKNLGNNFNSQERGISALQALLVRTLHLPATAENEPFFATIKQGIFKERGYFLRLFSDESWEEWTESRTALGRVVAQLKDCVESNTPSERVAKSLDKRMLKRANEEAAALIKGLDYPNAASVRLFHTGSRGKCIFGLVGGTVGSLMTHHPLPLVMGLTQCLPIAFAQQKVGNEFQVNTYTNDVQGRPSVTSFNNGNFVVTWDSYLQDGSNNGVYGQLFDGSDTKIGMEFQINTYTLSAQWNPSVASFPNDNFVVTWNSNLQDGSSDGIYGQLFDVNGTKIGNEFQVNTYIIEFQSAPSVTSLSNGNFVAVWLSDGQDGSGFGIFGQLFDENGNKNGPEFQVNTYTTDWQINPSVASFPNGNFVVTWTSVGQDGSNGGVYSQLFDGTGTKIGGEFLVNTYTQNSQGQPSVASFSNGNFVVTWKSYLQDGSSTGVYSQLFDGTGTKIGSEFQANTYTTAAQWVPSVASFPNCNFVAVWQSDGQDGSIHGVYGQLFDENGTKIGSEFQVNTYTLNDQEYPSVACLENGNFVVTWESDGQDGSNNGIYGQIFHDNVTYPPISSTTSSSTTSTTSSSTTSTTSSSTSSTTSSSTSSTNPSSSSTKSSSTTSSSRSTSLRSSSETSNAMSSTSPPSKRRLLWLWLLLGLGSGMICFGGIGYLFKRSKDEREDDDVHTAELETMRQPDHVSAQRESDYQYTPDHVSAQRESDYLYTPDHVSAQRESDYLYTPDHVSAVEV